MRVGLISDTHGMLRPEVFAAFSGVDHILHAGDIGDPDIILALAAIAPVTAVWGNTDRWDIVKDHPEIAEIDLDGVRTVVIHGHQYGSPTASRVARAHPDAGLVVFGHSHQPEIAEHEGVLAVNPGSAGPARFTLPITVAVATCEAGRAEASIVELVPREG